MNIPFTDFGGSGPQLHFLNANGYPPECYQPLFSYLTQNFQVFGILMRPFWSNSSPQEIKDWHLFSSDYLRFFRNKVSEPVIAVGHSMGGIIALRAALHEPDHFKALVLIDPVLFHPWHILIRRLIFSRRLLDQLHPLIRTTRYRRREFLNLETAFKGFRRKRIFRYFTDENLQIYLKGITRFNEESRYELIFSPEWEMRVYATGIWNDMDIWKRIKDLHIPLLVIRGSETDTFLKKAVNLLKKEYPQSEITNINNSTHLVPLEKPQEVAEIILQFLQEHR